MAAMESRMSCTRTRHSLGDTNGFLEDLLPEGGMEALGGGEINRMPQKLAEGALETHELEQADRCRPVVLHEEVEIASLDRLPAGRRAEQAKLTHSESLEEIAMRRKRLPDVGRIHGQDSSRHCSSRHAQP
jgi:hypothetical protein